MPLSSDVLKGDQRLEACLTTDSAHLTDGTAGSHVAKVQLALLVADGTAVQPDEEKAQLYGPSTAAAVLAFKTKRQIINRKYQSQPDSIVGKMTIAALDRELLRKQLLRQSSSQTYCGNDDRNSSVASRASVRQSAFAPAASASISGVSPSIGLTTGGSSPSAVAKSRAAGAIAAVAKARLVLNRLITFRKRPTLPIPADLGLEWDALWFHFGMPKFPLFNPLSGGSVNDLATYLSIVDQVLEGMALNLAQASTLFLEPRAPAFPEAHAFTLRGKRAAADPPGEPDGMFFNPRYLADPAGVAVGPFTQTEVIVHECAHFVNNENIQDPVFHVLSSAYGYSNYVLHCAFRRSSPFKDSE